MSRQLLHLGFAGELDDPTAITFVDLAALDIVGILPDDASAHAAWRAKAQATVDQATACHFVVQHRLLDPAPSESPGGQAAKPSSARL